MDSARPSLKIQLQIPTGDTAHRERREATQGRRGAVQAATGSIVFGQKLLLAQSLSRRHFGVRRGSGGSGRGSERSA